jgi:hypothetical protein
MVTVSGTHTLVFPDEELYEDYKKAKHAMEMEAYAKIRAKYGIFASNQNKFVDAISQFNKYDNRRTENAYQEWLTSK